MFLPIISEGNLVHHFDNMQTMHKVPIKEEHQKNFVLEEQKTESNSLGCALPTLLASTAASFVPVAGPWLSLGISSLGLSCSIYPTKTEPENYDYYLGTHGYVMRRKKGEPIPKPTKSCIYPISKC